MPGPPVRRRLDSSTRAAGDGDRGGPPKPYQRVVALAGAGATIGRMLKRVVAGLVWAYTVWYAVSLTSATVMPLPALLGPALGGAVGLVAAWDPYGRFWRRGLPDELHRVERARSVRSGADWAD
jgi:hypothetical protein